MEKKTAYSEKLRDPKWQKRRLEILNRDEFTCQNCHDTKSTLHVHHISYNIDLDPWEYGDHCLITFCENCHFKVSELKKEIKLLIDFNFTHEDSLSELKDILENIKNYNPYDLMMVKKSTDNG